MGGARALLRSRRPDQSGSDAVVGDDKDGDGLGEGDSDRDGLGEGNRDGDSDGDGFGSGDVNCDGNGDGEGFGSGDVNCDGDGDGDGDSDFNAIGDGVATCYGVNVVECDGERVRDGERERVRVFIRARDHDARGSANRDCECDAELPRVAQHVTRRDWCAEQLNFALVDGHGDYCAGLSEQHGEREPEHDGRCVAQLLEQREREGHELNVGEPVGDGNGEGLAEQHGYCDN